MNLARFRIFKAAVYLVIIAVIILAVFVVKITREGPRKSGEDITVEPETESKITANANAIKAMLERYAMNKFQYPNDIWELSIDNFLPSISDPSYPQNPFTQKPVRIIAFKEEPYAGEMTYLPVRDGGKVKGFYLIAYGDKKSKGEDVDKDGKPDQVVVVIKGPDYEFLEEKFNREIADKLRRFLLEDLPPLADVIHNKNSTD
jgi:hypothetical protein